MARIPHSESTMIGARLGGRYRVIEEIGRGGMGVVYRAYDEELNRSVAVKVLPTASLEDESARRRFLEEALRLAPLNHPNVVTVHDKGSDDGVDFLVMEHVPGTTLDQMLKGGALPEPKVVELGIQLAEGLAAAHAERLIHRDLKPGNVRVTPDGLLKILDFGLSKLLQESRDLSDSKKLTAPYTVVGTLPYMAPEQLCNGRLDERVDIYAAGAVLYEMATGQCLYPGLAGEALINAILNEKPKPPRAANPRLSSALDHVIMRALEKDPQDRYRTTPLLLDELKKLIEPPGNSRSLAWALSAVVLAAAAMFALPAVIHLLSNAKRPTLAVLPFRNLSPDPEQEYFTDGMTDEMISQLGRLTPKSLGVIGHTSVMKYKGATESIHQIGHELGADYLLEGSVRRAAQRVRVTAELDRVSDQTHLWADQYEEDVADVFALQTKIAKGIAQTLVPKLLEASGITLPRPPTESPVAHEAYLKGRYFWNRRSEEGLTKAIHYFELAVAADSVYAIAHAGLADSYLLLSAWGYRAPHEVMPLAKAEALKALAGDDSLAEAHTSLASILQDYDWDWPAAEREFKRALELNPNYATAHQWYADFLVKMGRMDESLKEIQRATELDPLSPVISEDLGTYYLYARRYDRAVAQYQKTIDLDENFASVYQALGMTLWRQGRYGEAVTALQKGLSLSDAGQDAVASLGRAFAASGPAGVWRWRLDLLNQMALEGYVSPYDFAVTYSLLGERDQALAWLEKAFREHSTALAVLRVDPLFDSLRSDPRFQRLLHRMRLPA